jgi:hypothetical protein
VTELKAQLSRVKEPPTQKKGRPKVSEAIVRRKLALLAGNGVDRKYPSNHNAAFLIYQSVTVGSYEKGFATFQALVRGHSARKLYKKRGIVRVL